MAEVKPEENSAPQKPTVAKAKKEGPAKKSVGQIFGFEFFIPDERKTSEGSNKEGKTRLPAVRIMGYAWILVNVAATFILLLDRLVPSFHQKVIAIANQMRGIS